MFEAAPMETQIRQFIIDNFLFGDEADFSVSDSLVESGIMDSLGVMETVNYIEETYQIEIPDAELLPENLDSVQNIVRFVGQKLKV